jgi:hypothetical protein
MRYILLFDAFKTVHAFSRTFRPSDAREGHATTAFFAGKALLEAALQEH